MYYFQEHFYTHKWHRISSVDQRMLSEVYHFIEYKGKFQGLMLLYHLQKEFKLLKEGDNLTLCITKLV
jgi:hypothetical protein